MEVCVFQQKKFTKRKKQTKKRPPHFAKIFFASFFTEKSLERAAEGSQPPPTATQAKQPEPSRRQESK